MIQKKKGFDTIMDQEVKEIPFNGNTLLGVKTPDGKVWLAVRKASIDIGLTDGQADNEVKKVKSSLLFKNEWNELSVKYDGQVRTTLMLSEKFVPMWLAQIRLTPTMKKENRKVVETLLTYQLEAADVLHKAFYETEEQKDNFHRSMNLEGEIIKLENKLEITVIQLNNVEETLEIQNEKFNAVMDNMTLTTVQQGKLQRAVKDRVNYLLGGAHSREYKENSKLYFINLWNGLKECFNCESRWQNLNPKYFNEAFDYISTWKYTEN